MSPLVSVITPTWRRHEWLFDRCIASVRAQTYSPVEHVVISDGPDPELRALMTEYARTQRKADDPALVWECLEPQDRGGRWGVKPRLRGLELCTGELIAYLDDDDAYRPDHCMLLVKALTEHPEAGFAYSQMASHGSAEVPTVIGDGEVAPCAIGTPMIMHRRELLQLATWGPPDPMEDWRLVDRWMERGIKTQFVPWVTVDVWPSVYRS